MKRYGKYCKFDDKNEFISYFNHQYGNYCWNDDYNQETLRISIYDRIIKDGEFPVILQKVLNDPDTRTILGDYSLELGDVGLLKSEISSLKTKAKAIDTFIGDN